GVVLTAIRDLVYVEGPPPASAADLALAKTGAPDPVPAGSTLTYVLTASNLGPDTAAQVVVTDPLPAGLTFDAAASDARCGASAGTVTCGLGDVAAGASASVSVVAAVDAGASGVLSNTATVKSATPDPDGGNDSAIADVGVVPPPPPTADLALTKSAAPDPLVVGSDLTYTLTAANAGPDDAPAVRVTDTLPALLRFDPARSGPACAGAAGDVTCDLGTVAANASAVATITAVPLLPADLGVTRLDVVPGEPIVLGESLVYAAEVVNHGPGDARDVVLTTLAAGFDDAGNPTAPPLDAVIGSAHPSRGSCAALGARGAPPLACALGTLLPGETARVTVVVTPNTATTGVGLPGPPLTNMAHVRSGAPGIPDLDAHAGNDRRTVDAVVLPASGPNLAVTRVDVQPATPIVLGDALTYTLEVANLGAGDAAEVRLYTLASGFDPGGTPAGPPLDVTVLSFAASQGTCADLGAGTGPIECPLGALPAGARATVTVVARPNSATVAPGLPDAPVVSRSRVGRSGAADAYPDDDEAETRSVVLPAAVGADLAVTALTVAPAAPVVQGGELTYAITVANFGAATAPDVVLYTMAGAFLDDGRPTGLPLAAKTLSVTPSQGACLDLGGDDRGPLECALGALAPGASAHVTVVVTTETPTVLPGAPDVPLVNGASVTTAAALAGNDPDAHRANNRAFAASTVLARLPDRVDNAARVEAGIGDPDPANDDASASTSIVAPAPVPTASADLAVALAGPAQAPLGAGTAYALTATNLGPDPAIGGGVLVRLGRGLTLAAVSPAQGSCAGTATVYCALGDLAAGVGVPVALVVRPDVPGTHTISAQVSAAASLDPVPANDVAT
ncbi:MAG TPA: DUF11 domain-containing protein, partial [Solirubrobacter sp.]|nr:DUF11 domain-containing protein [Solirubrobacter sp.]